jgi:outer membrane immunogenic protein
MKRVIIALGAAVAIAAPAAAADLGARMPVKAAPAAAPIMSWTGLYIGGHIGYGWTDSSSTVVTNPAGGSFPVGTVIPQKSDGFLGGGQVGLNYQWNQLVLGVEADFSWTDISSSSTTPSPIVAGATSTTDSRLRSVTLLTGRLGFVPTNNVLLYVKGGGAWGDFETEGATHNAAGVVTSYSTGGEIRSGWTIGGGAEWAFLPNWSAKVEYNYIDFGTTRVDRTITTPGGALIGVFQRDIASEAHLVKVGLNYRLNWWQ